VIGPLSARDRARQALTGQVLDIARRQLAANGVSGLSVRSVARELGMVSSAVYRYVPSREALLTMVAAEAHDAVGELAERADRAAAAAGGDAGARWLAVARAVRTWALTHPHEFELIFGTLPVDPPNRAEIRAVRLWRVVLAVMEAAVISGLLIPSRHRLAVQGVLDPRLQPLFGDTRRPPFEDAPIRSIALMSGLIGAIAVELHGHYARFSQDLDALFDVVIAAVADGAGLRLPVGRTDRVGSEDGPRQDGIASAESAQDE
jgi:AcrR family transcriptional regulator